jgi:hypothetical protein
VDTPEKIIEALEQEGQSIFSAVEGEDYIEIEFVRDGRLKAYPFRKGTRVVAAGDTLCLVRGAVRDALAKDVRCRVSGARFSALHVRDGELVNEGESPLLVMEYPTNEEECISDTPSYSTIVEDGWSVAIPSCATTAAGAWTVATLTAAVCTSTEVEIMSLSSEAMESML